MANTNFKYLQGGLTTGQGFLKNKALETNGALYGKGVEGYADTLAQLAQYSDVLDRMLKNYDKDGLAQYFDSAVLQGNQGDVYSVRRYVGLKFNLDDAKLTKTGVESPLPIAGAGLAVSVTVNIYGGLIQTNDFTSYTHPDDLMGIYGEDMQDAIMDLKEQTALEAAFKGGSIITIKTSTFDKDKNIEKYTLGTKLTTAETAGTFNYGIFRDIAHNFDRNIQSAAYRADNGAGVISTKNYKISAPIPKIDGSYHVVCSNAVKRQLQDSPLSRLIASPEKRTSIISGNELWNVYGITFHVTSAWVTLKESATAYTGIADKVLEPNYLGDYTTGADKAREVAFMFGKGFGKYVTLSNAPFKLVSKPLDQPDSTDLLGRRSTLGWKGIWSHKVTYSPAIVAVIGKVNALIEIKQNVLQVNTPNPKINNPQS